MSNKSHINNIIIAMLFRHLQIIAKSKIRFNCTFVAEIPLLKQSLYLVIFLLHLCRCIFTQCNFITHHKLISYHISHSWYVDNTQLKTRTLNARTD